MGVPVVAPRWVLASAARSDTTDARLVVFNPSDTVAASLRLIALVDGREVPLEGPATVEPRRRVDIDLQLPAGAAATSVVVEAGGQVVVERSQTYTPLPDFSVEPAVPVPDGAEVPRPLG